MRATVVSCVVLASTVAALTATASGSAHGVDRSTRARFAQNPCAGADSSEMPVVLNAASSWVVGSYTDSIDRASYGLTSWPEDSVVITTDSIVCSHVDSLISLWLASPAAGDVVRGPYWTTLTVARINPSKYYAQPAVLTNGYEYNFIVDSVTGQVQFYRTLP